MHIQSLPLEILLGIIVPEIPRGLKDWIYSDDGRQFITTLRLLNSTFTLLLRSLLVFSL